MKITESKLRRIIRSVILESVDSGRLVDSMPQRDKEAVLKFVALCKQDERMCKGADIALSLIPGGVEAYEELMAMSDSTHDEVDDYMSMFSSAMR